MPDPSSVASIDTASDALSTRAATALAGFLPMHEEHEPFGFDEDPGECLPVIAGHVGDAARLALDPDFERVAVAVPLIWVVATALAALPHVEPDPDTPHLVAKQALLERVDRIAARRGEHQASHTLAERITRLTAELGSAFEAVAIDDDAALASSLFDLAVAAVVATECLELDGF